MSKSEICANAKATSNSSAADQEPPVADDNQQTEQSALQVVKVPSKIILDLILDKLDLPRAKYEFYEAEHCQVYATITFYVSTHRPKDLLQRVVMEGVLTTDSDIAEESVALEGIRYMENLEGIVIEDLNFSELKYVQEQNRDLQAKLEASDEDNQAQRAGLHLALTGMTGVAHRMYDLTDKYRSVGQYGADRNNNVVLEKFDKATFDLQRLTGHLTKFL